MKEKITKIMRRFLEWLSSTPKVGALHIQGTSLMYVRLDGTTEARSAKIPPGTIQGGRIADAAQFKAALAELRASIVGGEKEKLRVIAVIPAEPVYTQAISIPNVGKERLEESAMLNLQMTSPMGRDEAYMHYEVVGEAEDHYELLGAFVERTVVDNFRAVLEETGFSPIVFEFPSLSLTRLVARAVGASEDTMLGFYLSSDGLDFFIMKRGKLHFGYFRSWQSIQGNEREISRALFEEVTTREIQKVVNFSLGKFKERPKRVVLVAQGLEEEITKLLAERFGLPVVPLEIGGGFSAPWYAVLGAALRGKDDLATDQAVNLAPLSSRELFFQEQTIGFVKLWRSVIAGVLAIFLFFFASAALFLKGAERDVTTQLQEFTARFNESELADLTSQAERFNALVRAATDVINARVPWHELLKALGSVMDAHQVTLDRIDLSNGGTDVRLAARAPSNERLLSFKNALAADPKFSNVDLIVSSIVTLEDNSVGFTVTFTPVWNE